jgi:nucleoside-triphosphatase THEP1
MRKNILITGLPKSGKSTILRKIITNHNPKVGFVINEVRENGERTGFEIETNHGDKSLLASINFNTNFKVSKYYVEINNLNKILPKVSTFNPEDLLYIDEIAQMELVSESFKQLVLKYFNSPNTCLATLSKVYDDEFTEKIKNREDIILVEINEQNREEKEKFIEVLIRKISKAKRYVSDSDRFNIQANEVTINTDHGVRKLTKHNKEWKCSCDFYAENGICSHTIALEEFLKRK